MCPQAHYTGSGTLPPESKKESLPGKIIKPGSGNVPHKPICILTISKHLNTIFHDQLFIPLKYQLLNKKIKMYINILYFPHTHNHPF